MDKACNEMVSRVCEELSVWSGSLLAPAASSILGKKVSYLDCEADDYFEVSGTPENDYVTQLQLIELIETRLSGLDCAQLKAIAMIVFAADPVDGDCRQPRNKERQ